MPAFEKKNKKVLINCLMVVTLMVGFGYAMVPLYDVFCEITGLNGKTGVLSTAEAEQMAQEDARMVTVQFDGTVNSDLPWSFKPKQFSMEVEVGKLYATEYIAKNISANPVTGQAVPSVAPLAGSMYFNKTECFCFTEQLLNAGEEKNMPVTFIVDSDIPDDIHVLTLSYTFFNKQRMSTAQKAAAADANHDQI